VRDIVEAVKKDWSTKVALVLFTLLTVWWLFLQLFYKAGSREHDLFSDIYGVMALWGVVWGLVIAQKWGGFKSVMGRAILFFSFGLLAQEFGQLAYSYYYYVRQIEVPYPSWGDLGYFGSIPLYIYAITLLAKASGLEISLQSFKPRLQAIIIPLCILIASYFIFLPSYVFDWSKPLNIILDFGYPLGEATYISLALVTYLLSRKILGGIMKNKIFFILFALFLQYLADFTFLYQANNQSWTAGGINDYMYLTAYFIMTLGLLQLNIVLVKLKQTT